MDNIGKANLTSQLYRPLRILSTVTIPTSPERILFVHAHPDDETISTGGTIAALRNTGAAVTVVTCTRGEQGEVVPTELQHLSGETLGEYRTQELAAALRVLGVEDHRFLGYDGACAVGAQPHRYRDSGMQWGADGVAEPRSDGTSAPEGAEVFASANPDRIVDDVLAVIGDVSPSAIVSYDERGGYGHPDHVRAHDAALVAAQFFDIPFFAIVPQGHEARGDLVVDIAPLLNRKKDALRQYRTQLTVDGDSIVHSGGQVEHIRTVEVFRRMSPDRRAELDWTHLGLFLKVTSCILAAFIGSILGAVGTLHYQIAASAVSLTAVAALLIGLRLLFRSRIVALCAAIGVLIIVGLFSMESAGGSVIVGTDTAGYVWTLGVPVLALIVLVWPRRHRRVRDTMEKQTDSKKVVAES